MASNFHRQFRPRAPKKGEEDDSDTETIVRMGEAIEIISRQAPLTPGCMGLFRMWMKAMCMARPENPEIFSFAFMRAVDYLDRRGLLHADFYKNDGPRIDKAVEMEKEFKDWEKRKLQERLDNIRKTFYSKAGEETRNILKVAKDNMLGANALKNDLVEEHLKNLRREDEQTDQLINVRPMDDPTNRPAVTKKTRETLLRELVKQIRDRESLEKELQRALRHKDQVKIDDIKRRIALLDDLPAEVTLKTIFESEEDLEAKAEAELMAAKNKIGAGNPPPPTYRSRTPNKNEDNDAGNEADTEGEKKRGGWLGRKLSRKRSKSNKADKSKSKDKVKFVG